jgi:hypothetical protein
MANATHIQCGDVITESVTLDSDVLCPFQEDGPVALTIGADKITVDLNGFFVSSWGDPGAIDITTDGQRSKVVLRNSNPDNFGGSILLKVSHSRVENIATTSMSIHGDGNLVTGSRVVSLKITGRNNQIIGNVIGDQTAFDLESGLGISDFKNVVVRGNEIIAAGGAPITLLDGRGALIAHNMLDLSSDYPFPVWVGSNVSGVKLRANVIIGP